MAASSIPMPGKRFVIGVPYVWLFVFFLLPFLILLYISFVDMGGDISPFKPIWDPQTGILSLKYENYLSIFRTEEGAPLFKTLYVEAYVRSIWYALLTAIICLLIGYPFAYFIARSPASVRPALLLMVMLPFWTSFLLRVYAWKGLLADQGVINRFMMTLGITSEPIAAVSAMADPDTPPNMVQLITVTTPKPPGNQPNSTRANSTMRLPTPPWASSSPAKTNSGTASKMKGSTPPMKDRKMVSIG